MTSGVSARRVDANQKRIVQLARDSGISVAITSDLGKGFADTVWGYFGVNVLVEIKDGSKPPSARKLTQAEQKFKDNWKGDYRVISTDDEAMALIKEMMKAKKCS